MLTRNQKRLVENEMVRMISMNPSGINTRSLITGVVANVSGAIPYINRHHVSGMLSWVMTSGNYGFKFITKAPGNSKVA